MWGNTGNSEPFALRNSYDRIQIGGPWDDLDQRVSVAFTKDKCSWDSSSRELNCAEGDPDLGTNPREQNIFVSRRVSDLDNVQMMTSRFPVNRLEVRTNSNQLQLHRIYRYQGVTTTESLTVERGGALQCKAGNDPSGTYGHRVQADLVRYTER